MNIAQHLEVAARRHADRLALIAGDRQWTYAELDEAASALAGGLAGLGLQPGERLGLHLPNWPEFVLAYYAAQKVGLVPLSLNVTYKAEKLEYILRDAAASAVITAAPVAANLPATNRTPSVRHTLDARDLGSLTGRPVRALDLDRDQTAAILYTSATTGRPKGVMLTHGNTVSNAYATVHHLRMTPEDRGLCAVPLFHCHGITLLYGVPTMYILFLSPRTSRSTSRRSASASRRQRRCRSTSNAAGTSATGIGSPRVTG